VNFLDAGYNGTDNWGTNAGQGVAGNVYVDNIEWEAGLHGGNQTQIDNALGNVAAHELFHSITGLRDLPFDPDEPRDLMTQDFNPNGPFQPGGQNWNAMNNNLGLVAWEKNALRALCDHPNGH